MIWLCVTPERHDKTARLMGALAGGMKRDARIIVGAPPDDGNPFVVWGQQWLALETVPKAYEQGRPFWQIDNGFWQPARGGVVGYYRLSYRGFSPVLMAKPDMARLQIPMKPWRGTGRHIVLALPGQSFGQAIGLDMPAWGIDIRKRLARATHRPVTIRPKGGQRPLSHDLRNAWALLTHSSNVAVDAVVEGIPVFVEPSNPAAPVGRTDLEFERPVMPDRKPWWASLMSQQFTLNEMASGLAYRNMQMIAEQVDGK